MYSERQTIEHHTAAEVVFVFDWTKGKNFDGKADGAVVLEERIECRLFWSC